MNLLLILALAQATPTGIDVDTEGVLRSRSNDPDPRLADLWKNAKNLKKDGKYLYVSLPRLFAEARALLDRKQPLPDEIKYVGGITKLEYVFVYPGEKDLIIAGPSEPVDAKDPFRPLGKITGRPVLQLDDLVIALRVLKDGIPDRIGCDIEMTKEIDDRITKAIKGLGPVIEQKGKKEAAKHVSKQAGPMPVKYYGVPTDTRIALVSIEADYRLKELTLGLMKSPVPKVKSFLSLCTDKDQPHRFSLESDYQALGTAENAYHLRGHSLRVDGGLRDVSNSQKEMMGAAKKFIDLCNQNFTELLKHVVCFADLANLSDLLVLAALIHQDKLAEKAGWDLSPLADWPVATYRCPKTVETLCNYGTTPKLIYVVGGVLMNPGEIARNREKEDQVAEKAQRPGEGWKKAAE